MTVISITIRPSLSERSKLPPMSPIDCGWNTCANQWVLKPCIGKTRPPVRPWNDRTVMVIVGP